jgi:membrane protein DedA with SNARE-associated domain
MAGVSIPSISHLGQWAYAFVFALTALQAAGVPLPGTTALIAAAVYAGTSHHLQIASLIVAAALGATVGSATGFALGWRGGWGLIRRYGRRVGLTPARIKVGRYVFATHGGKVVFFGRFITGLRTWGAFLAGANRMRPRRFLLFSTLSAILWSTANGLQYYYFGHLLDLVGTALGIVLILAGIALTIAGGLFLRRRGQSVARAAELAMPEPIDYGG